MVLITQPKIVFCFNSHSFFGVLGIFWLLQAFESVSKIVYFNHNFIFRNFAVAAKAGVKKALDSGSKSPLLFFNAVKYPHADIVAILGAMEAIYVPLEVRDQVPEKAVKVSKLGILGDSSKFGSQIDLAKALEAGRIVSRDIGGSDPERMAAPR